MKTLILVLLALFFTADVAAQVIFRNDFVIRRNSKIRNLGLTTITINLNKYPNFNQLINGRGGRTLVIDVRVLRRKRVDYSYAEIAEKIYMPPVITSPLTQTTPFFLATGLPDAKYPFATSRGLNLDSVFLTHRSQ